MTGYVKCIGRRKLTVVVLIFYDRSPVTCQQGAVFQKLNNPTILTWVLSIIFDSKILKKFYDVGVDDDAMNKSRLRWLVFRAIEIMYFIRVSVVREDVGEVQ